MKLCRRGADHRSTQLEFLERRDLLAGDLVAHWVADQRVSASLEDAVVIEWSDQISGISAAAFGSPTLINEGMGRRPVVRFDEGGSKDWLQVGKSDNPLSGANDFSIAVLFQSNGTSAEGDGVTWNTGTGVVHMNQLGFNDDWGLTLHPDGRISTGLGAGFLGTTTSLFSNLPVTDGQPHLVTMVRSGDTLSLAVDDGPPVTVDGATLNPRVTVDLFFGVGVDSQQVFVGDIAEVRIYDGALDAAEQAALQTELDTYYNNQAPQALPDQYQVDEDGILFALPDDGVLANDIDADGDELTAEVVSQPGHGEVALGPNGSIIYSPLPNFFGIDSFTYAAVDFGPSEPTTVTIHVLPTYDPATGVADQYKSTPDRQLNIPALVGVLSNDHHIDNLPMTAVLADGITNVPFTLQPDGSFTFDPQGQAGTYAFTYRIDDGVELSSPIPVEIIINTAPQTSDDVVSLTEDSVFRASFVESILANDMDADGQALSVTILSEPDVGSLVVEEGGWQFIPPTDFVGQTSFTYSVSDGVDESAVAAVTLLVTAVNDAPLALPETYFTAAGETLTVDSLRGILANDVDVDSPVLTVRSIPKIPEHGQLTWQADGSFVYQPNNGFVGTDQFQYVVQDDVGARATGIVSLYVGRSPVQISEVMLASAESLVTRTRLHPDDRFVPGEQEAPDWIELQNLTSADLDLSGYQLTDDSNHQDVWTVPHGVSIPANGYLVIFASGLDITDTNLDEIGLYHTNFKLSGETGDYLALLSTSGELIQEFAPMIPPQVADVSYGLMDGEFQYLISPTPGAANVSETRAGIELPAEADVPAGYFESPFAVTLTTDSAGGTIYYSLDSSTPSPETGLVYTCEPISIERTVTLRARVFQDGLLPSAVTTYSYLFLDQVLSQPALPEGFPDTWGRAGRADYEMDARVATDTTSEFYNPNVRPGLQSHPSISLVTDAAHLFDRETGIQSNPQSRGVAWERPVSMEWITEQGVQQIQIDAGLRMQGNASRNPDRPKHNMRLLFKERYGASKLEFPLFPESDVDQFDTFILRGGNGDSWFHPNATQQGQAQYIRDQWSRETQREMGRFTVSQRYVHLYINGLYWGLYHIFERVNASFFAEHLGGEPADYDVLAHKNETVDGNRDAWDEMMRIARTDTESAESYQAIQQFIDLPALADYLLIGFYAANTDWDQNNWFGGRKREDGAQFQFFTWDAERTFVSVNTDRTTFNNSNQPSELHQRLSRNEEYRLMFADRIHEHFFHDGTLTPAAAEARWLKFAAEIEIPLAAESARWGDAKRRSRPYTPDREWKAELDRLQRTWFPRRTDIVMQQLRRRGLYPDTVAPTFSQHGGEYVAGFQLAMTAPDGVIYYTTDGSDPRLPGGNISASAKLFDGQFALAGDVTVNARTWLAGEWSALNDATFLAPSVAADDRSLRISEIHFHPGSPSEAEIVAGFADADEFEFLELMNVSDQVIRLDDVKLVEVLIDGSEQGVAFDFAGSDWQRLSPGERLILVENKDAFALRYGTELPVAGQWNGKLSNGGEYLTVENGDGILLQFQYDDNWYPETDGAGSSLELIDPAGSGEQWFVRRAWQASIVGGTPGSQARAVRVAGDSTGDGIFNSADLVAVFQAGEYEDGIVGNSTLEEGDWNGDGEFSTQDLVFAFQQGTYVAEAVPWTVNGIDSVFRTNRPSPIDRHWDAAEDSRRSVGPNLKRNLRVLAVDDFFQDFYY